MLRLFTMLIAIGFAGFAHAQDAVRHGITPGSKWVNELGSEMEIVTVDPNGAITGIYINRAAGFDCQDEPMALSGWLNRGLLISFSVRWKNEHVDCDSLTGWTGYYASGQIFTNWELVYISARTGLPTRLDGSDTFMPQ